MANPYWGASLSRRWQLFEHGPVKGFVGFGVAAKTESDDLSVTRWDFASQLGLRFRLPGNRVIGEVTMRHWSNGGLRLPNHGQDFATVTFHLNSGLFGVGRADQIPIDPSFNLDRPAGCQQRLGRGAFAMSDDELGQVILKKRKLKELRRARERVKQLERQLRGEPAKPEEPAYVPEFLRMPAPVPFRPAVRARLSRPDVRFARTIGRPGA